MSSAHLDRVAEAIWLADGSPGMSWDATKIPFLQHRYRALAQAAIEALELTEHFAVSSGERRQFEQFDTRDQAERGLHCHVTNNEHWQAKGRELPVWARDPRIVSRLVSSWRADGEVDA